MAKLVKKMGDTFDTGFTLEEYAEMWLSRIEDDLLENQGIENTEEQMNLVFKVMARKLKEMAQNKMCGG